MIWHRAATFAALFLFLFGPLARAQDITLTSRDGAVEITGTLLGYDGEFYRVETRFGELTLDGSGVLCDGPGCPSLSDFVAEIDFSGSSTIARVLMPALVEGFALRNGYDTRASQTDESHQLIELIDRTTQDPRARLRFRVTNTDEGFADLLANEADIAMALREIRPTELLLAKEAGLTGPDGTIPHRVLALDAVVPIVAPDNPVRRISAADLARVYSGDLTNWAEVGGPDAPISVHMPAQGSGLSQAVEDYVLAPGGLALAETIQRHRLNADMVRAVTRDPFGIGVASFAETGDARGLPLSGGCGFAISPSRRSIKTEDYPLTSPVFLYLPARRLPKEGREFLKYLRGPMAQNVIRRAGFVDQAPEEMPIDAQGARFAHAILAAGQETTLDDLREMTAFLAPLRRLSLSFRFEPGSSRPDAQSRANVEYLADLLETGAVGARRLVFVGFSDGDGAAASNRRIAAARARHVRDAVREMAGAMGDTAPALETEAFGEALPMACDDSEWGRKINRRVEVWVE
ncbi:MAG: cell envelope biogenesis protein OmpA [Pseudooceanicola sp.]|nr:cell envelope biogenesis protein OmpA [Pseudooceanicola sp.]